MTKSHLVSETVDEEGKPFPGSFKVLTVFRKLFKNFLSQAEPIWILNTCYDFSISSVYFLISSQIRLKSFHLEWHGYALK